MRKGPDWRHKLTGGWGVAEGEHPHPSQITFTVHRQRGTHFWRSATVIKSKLFCMLRTHLQKICRCGSDITGGRITFALWLPPMLVMEGLMLLDTTGKDFSPVTLLTADWTPQCYQLPGESAARGVSCSSRLFASTQMDVLYMTLNRSNMWSASDQPTRYAPPRLLLILLSASWRPWESFTYISPLSIK